MSKFLLLWGEAPEYEYEDTFETYQEALDWVNTFGPNWNRNNGGHWFTLYEKRRLVSDSMWEDMKTELEGSADGLV